MYCGNCGNKIENENVSFCKKCGTKIIKTPKKINKPKKHITVNFTSIARKKSTKVVLVVIVLILIYIFINNLFFSEDATIKSYVKAYANNDYQKIIKLTNIDKNKFMSKKSLTEKYSDKTNKYVKVDILSTNKSKAEHSRTVAYKTLDSEKNIMNLKIKQVGRRYLIFKKYAITSTDLIAKNVTITAPKDYKITIDNVVLDNKYKIKEKSSVITYKVPLLLKKNVKEEITLSNNLTITNIKNVYSNETLTTKNLYNATIDEASNKNIKDKIKNSITLIVNSAILYKDKETIMDKKIFTEKLLSSSTFIDNYMVLKDKYSTKEITSFKIDNIKISSININDNKHLSIKSTISYSYKNNGSKRSGVRSVIFGFDNDLNIDELYISNLYTLF